MHFLGKYYTIACVHISFTLAAMLISFFLLCPNVMFHSANVTLGEKEERMMITGMHIVADIFCVCCGSNVGWKYVSQISNNLIAWFQIKLSFDLLVKQCFMFYQESAYEKSQKYKEGKFILERYSRICNIVKCFLAL